MDLPLAVHARLLPYVLPCDISSVHCVSKYYASVKHWEVVTAEEACYIFNVAEYFLSERRGLDFSRLRGGSENKELRRDLLRTMIIRLVPPVASECVPIVAGSYALHTWLRFSEQKAPLWTPGDIDVWLPNMSTSTSVSNILRESAYSICGVTLVCEVKYSTSNNYTLSKSTAAKIKDAKCTVANVCDLSFSVDDPNAASFAGKDKRIKRDGTDDRWHKLAIDTCLATLSLSWKSVMPKRNQIATFHMPIRTCRNWRKWFRTWQQKYGQMVRRHGRNNWNLEGYSFLRNIAGNWIAGDDCVPGIVISEKQKKEIEAFSWCKEYRDLMCTENLQRKSNVLKEKISLISVVPSRTKDDRVRKMITHQDILDRFDIDICQCGFYFDKSSLKFLIKPDIRMSIQKRVAKVIHACPTASRSSVRLDKYKDRGFRFPSTAS